MSETEQNLCNFCKKPYDPDVFNVENPQFYAGRKVRLVQGNCALSGTRGIILADRLPPHNPGLYEVRLEIGSVVKVRWDHMMFEDLIEIDPHYRELYMHRLESGLYEYQETKF